MLTEIAELMDFLDRHQKIVERLPRFLNTLEKLPTVKDHIPLPSQVVTDLLHNIVCLDFFVLYVNTQGVFH